MFGNTDRIVMHLWIDYNKFQNYVSVKKTERKQVTTSKFVIPISLQANVVELYYFILWPLFSSNSPKLESKIHTIRFQRFRKFEIVKRTSFHGPMINKGYESLSQTLIFYSLYLCNQMLKTLGISIYEVC